MRLILPDDLHTVWDEVRTGLVEVQKFSAEDWFPEDIYMAIKGGNAALYVGYTGFLVMQLIPMYHGKRLHVWCAYSKGRPALRVFLRFIKETALSAGARKITFLSPRDEWLSVSKRGGFKPTQTIFELEL